MEAILSNSTRKLVWFVITKMLIEGQRNKFIMSFIIFLAHFHSLLVAAEDILYLYEHTVLLGDSRHQ